MKIKHTVIIYVIGVLVELVGIISRSTHFPDGTAFYLSGVSIKVIGFLLFLYKISTHPKVKEFFES